jgi:hypothetical protein
VPRSADRALVFLDVDGTLITFRARPTTAARRTSTSDDAAGNPLLDRLEPDDGRRLRELGCDLVWATTWMDEANEVISPRLGLPQLPVVQWPDVEHPHHGLHWKTVALTRWAAGRPFVWLDDEITDADRRWVAAHHPGRALLHRVDPHTGLVDTDFALIHRWLIKDGG